LLGRQLGNKQTFLLEDLHRQPLMTLGVETIQTGSQHRQVIPPDASAC
jgi:hypothetical protein